MRTRLARPEDVAAISRLISEFVEQGLLLPRSPEEVRAHLNRFIVLTEMVPAMDAPQGAPASSERLLGCVALEPYGPDLAEVRSLAVRPDEQGRGLGGRLLEAAHPHRAAPQDRARFCRHSCACAFRAPRLRRHGARNGAGKNRPRLQGLLEAPPLQAGDAGGRGVPGARVAAGAARRE